MIVKNAKGEDVGADRTFGTYAFADPNSDSCPNVLARKQTRTGTLLDCRAYELASAAFTGGYDVSSNLDGETPLSGYPDSEGKLLYSVDHGGIPGTGSPTNLGQDPYVAVRDSDGWTTRYVGIPADAGFSSKRFASNLTEGSSGLESFVFDEPNGCSPCFGDGSTGLPVRRPDGVLENGIQGSIPQPGAEPSGYIGRYLSANGQMLVFGTTAQLEPEDTDGGQTIYQRDLLDAHDEGGVDRRDRGTPERSGSRRA